MTRSIYFPDPDGNRVELYCDMVEHGFEAMQTMGPARDLLEHRDRRGREALSTGTVNAESPRGDGLYPPAAYAREDESPDGGFYGFPRKVVHIDDGAIVALGRAAMRRCCRRVGGCSIS